MFDEMWFLTTGPVVVKPVIFAFPSERTAGVSSRSFTVTNKSTSLTYTVASSFVSTSPLAVKHCRRTFRDPYSFQFGRVKVFPADHMHACSGVHHKLSFLQLFCGCGRQNPLIGRRKECSFFPFFELKDILGKSARVSAGASLWSFSLLLRSVLTFHSVGTALMRTSDLKFIQQWTLLSRTLAIVLVELVPRLLCPSVKSLQIPAARHSAIHNTTAVHLSLLLLHFCHHPSSAFCSVVPQPSSAEMGTPCRIYIPIQTYETDIREDGDSHKVILCKCLSRKFLHACRLVFPDGLLSVRLLFLDALLILGVGG